MDIVLNGERRTAPDQATVLELLQAFGIDPGRVAVELNGAIVKKTLWAETRVEPGSTLEVVMFVGGGSRPR